MNLFTDLEAACDEAQYLADNIYHGKSRPQRKAAYLVQRKDGMILVAQHKPAHGRIMKIFTPCYKNYRAKNKELKFGYE